MSNRGTATYTALKAEPPQSANRKWIVAFIGTLLATMMLQMPTLGFSPMLPAIQKEFELSYSQLGLFTGMYGLLALVTSVPAGLAATRFGEKRVVITGLVVVALGLLLFGVAPNFGVAFGARAFWLVGYRFAFVNLLTALIVISPPTLKSMSMGIMGATISVASVLGAPFGSGLARSFGWRGGIMGFSGAAVVAAVVFSLFYKRGANTASGADLERVGASSSRAASSGLRAGSAFRTPAVWGLALLLGMCGMGSFTATFFIPFAVKSVFKLDALAAAYIISTGFMVGIVANLLLGYLADHSDRWKTIIGALALMVPVSFLMATENLLIFRIAAALVLALGFAISAQVYAVAGELLGGSRAGEVMGIVSLGTGASGYLGPQILGFLRDWTGGFSAGWYLLTAVAGLATIQALFLWRHGRKHSPMQRPA